MRGVENTRPAASIESIRSQGASVQLASYDERLLDAAGATSQVVKPLMAAAIKNGLAKDLEGIYHAVHAGCFTVKIS
jgi:CO dehydrogenase/acetyl-CoA synthase gamma subunit (corrinoid Fe-S protein)